MKSPKSVPGHFGVVWCQAPMWPSTLKVMNAKFVGRAVMGLLLALALLGCSGSTGGAGSIEAPHSLGEPQAISVDILQTKGIADWDITIFELTEDVADSADDQLVNTRFEAVALLTASEQLPVTTLESFDFAIFGGATATTYERADQRCGDDIDFDKGMSVDVGETVEGSVCIAIPAADLSHPNTLVAVTFNLDEVEYFGEASAPAAT